MRLGRIAASSFVDCDDGRWMQFSNSQLPTVFDGGDNILCVWWNSTGIVKGEIRCGEERKFS